MVCDGFFSNFVALPLIIECYENNTMLLFSDGCDHFLSSETE